VVFFVCVFLLSLSLSFFDSLSLSLSLFISFIVFFFFRMPTSGASERTKTRQQQQQQRPSKTMMAMVMLMIRRRTAVELMRLLHRRQVMGRDHRGSRISRAFNGQRLRMGFTLAAQNQSRTTTRIKPSTTSITATTTTTTTAANPAKAVQRGVKWAVAKMAARQAATAEAATGLRLTEVV
jgi:hypothetical protein